MILFKDKNSKKELYFWNKDKSIVYLFSGYDTIIGAIREPLNSIEWTKLYDTNKVL